MFVSSVFILKIVMFILNLTELVRCHCCKDANL